MFKLLVIIDSHEYTFNEIYQSQLWERANQRTDVATTYVTFNDLYGKKLTERYDAIYVALKLRNTFHYRSIIQNYLGAAPVIIQDYDPWCNFIDDSPYKGSYQEIMKSLNVISFFVSAKSWSDMLNAISVPATAIKLGMLHRHINTNSHEYRRNIIEFRGTQHPTRLKGHEDLTRVGVPVQWLPTIKPYESFLKYIETLGTWCHNESAPLIVDKQPVCSNWVWPKGLEALHKGCFLLRDHQPEADHYGVSSLPTAFLFHDLNEAKSMAEQILTMSLNEKNQRMHETISMLRATDFYGDIINQIIAHG